MNTYDVTFNYLVQKTITVVAEDAERARETAREAVCSLYKKDPLEIAIDGVAPHADGEVA